jgi:L-ascorbate metabolism protein UlaG (beta-lactamase superfamily)
MRRKFRTDNHRKLTIVTPRGGQQKIMDFVHMLMGSLGDLFFGRDDEVRTSTNRVEVVELSNSSAKLEDMEVSAHDVEHVADAICNGYTINIDGKTVGFSGDAAKCEGIDKIVQASDVAMLDANTIDSNSFHLGVEGIVEYAEKYPEKQFYLVHRGDYEMPGLPKNVIVPNDGEEMEI